MSASKLPVYRADGSVAGQLQTYSNDLGDGPVDSEAVTPTDASGAAFSTVNPFPTADQQNPYRGTSTPSGGTSGTVSVADGHRVVSWMAHSTTGGSVEIDGATIPVPANSFMSDGWAGLVGPFDIVFAGTDSYHVVTNG